MGSPIIAQPLVYPSNLKPPSTTQGVIEAVAQYTMYLPQVGATFAILSSSTPAPTDQDKLWFQTDPVGRPMRINRFYNGTWRSFYTGRPYQVSLFVGDWPTYFDTTGLGLPQLGWDGWAISNGQNGTVDLTNRFIIPGYRCDGIGLWVTRVTGADAYSGGATSFTIQPYNLPPLAVTFLTESNFKPGTGRFGFTNSGTPATIPVNGTTGQNFPVACLPPFVAVGYAQFVGYA